MKTWRTNPHAGQLPSLYLKLIAVVFFVISFCAAYAQQELVFKNSILQSGSAGADGAVYRFPAVTANVDALVKIGGRSSMLVSLENIDLTNSGHNKSFQPQVTYNNGTAPGKEDWWMEFQISFVEANTNNLIGVTSFDVTTIDLDGNGDKLSEYVSLYKQTSYIMENVTLLTATSVTDIISGQSVNGKKFNGPVTNFVDIDTTATSVMVTNKYQNTNTLIIRAGAKTTGNTSATDRMYSFWFKAFTYQRPVQSSLPITLSGWNAIYSNNLVSLKWNTAIEQNSSHFIVEKSLNGAQFNAIAFIPAAVNSSFMQSYSYKEIIPAGTTGTIYYRLQMVDQDGKTQSSDVKMVSVGSDDMIRVKVYPNPVVNELRIAIPPQWQDKKVTYTILNAYGQITAVFTRTQASQIEQLNMHGMPKGIFQIKVCQGNETCVQNVIKSGD